MQIIFVTEFYDNSVEFMWHISKGESNKRQKLIIYELTNFESEGSQREDNDFR